MFCEMAIYMTIAIVFNLYLTLVKAGILEKIQWED